MSANMSRTSSVSSVQGFSILQPTLGATLSFLPAVGTKELDTLVDAYLPGPASAQEKRAAVVLEFFEYSARTGENFKYFVVPAMTSVATSPVGVSPSPVMSELTYASSSQASTPATPATKPSSRSVKRPETTDFSHLPGMKIITLDGQDVTNHVSRGCKTKEQRDHAHLMRILKACDACKKKKIRCDPSHKKRSASSVESAKSESVKPAKKSKKTSAPSATPKSQASAPTPAPPPEVDYQPSLDASLEDFSATLAEWDQYFTFNEPIDTDYCQNIYNDTPHDFSFFFEPETQFSPATSGSSAVSPAQPLTPTSAGVLAQAEFTYDDSSFTTFAPTDNQNAMLPYLASGAHGSNYVDFNLFSPSSGFIDEEPKKLKAGEKRKATAGPVAGMNESRCSSDVFHEHQLLQHQQQQQGVEHFSTTALSSAVSAWDGDSGLQVPFHNGDFRHGMARGATEVALLHGLASPADHRSPILSEVCEHRDNALLQSCSLNSSSRSVVALASMISEGVSPRAGCEVLVGPVGTQGSRLTRPSSSPVSSPVLQVVDRQQPRPQPQPTLPPQLSPSLSSEILSNSPSRQGQCVPAGGLASATAVDHQLRATAVLALQTAATHLSLAAAAINNGVQNIAPMILADIQTATPAILASLARHTASFSQQTAGYCPVTNTNAQQALLAASSAGLGSVNCHGIPTVAAGTRRSSALAQGPTDAVRPSTTPVQQLLAGSSHTTTLLSVVLQTSQLAVFGLVSLLLLIVVAVTYTNLQQQLHQLQYPVLASVIPIMMISLLSSTLKPQTTSFGKQSAVLDTVRSFLSGRAPLSSALSHVCP